MAGLYLDTENGRAVNAGRITGKDAGGWGYSKFLDHDKLQYNAERQTQYLKDNTLHIRVMKVIIS